MNEGEEMDAKVREIADKWHGFEHNYRVIKIDEAYADIKALLDEIEKLEEKKGNE